MDSLFPNLDSERYLRINMQLNTFVNIDTFKRLINVAGPTDY